MSYGETNEAWIVGAVRTPIGRHGGALSSVRPDDLGALARGKHSFSLGANTSYRIDVTKASGAGYKSADGTGVNAVKLQIRPFGRAVGRQPAIRRALLKSSIM